MTFDDSDSLAQAFISQATVVSLLEIVIENKNWSGLLESSFSEDRLLLAIGLLINLAAVDSFADMLFQWSSSALDLILPILNSEPERCTSSEACQLAAGYLALFLGTVAYNQDLSKTGFVPLKANLERIDACLDDFASLSHSMEDVSKSGLLEAIAACRKHVRGLCT